MLISKLYNIILTPWAYSTVIEQLFSSWSEFDAEIYFHGLRNSKLFFHTSLTPTWSLQAFSRNWRYSWWAWEHFRNSSSAEILLANCSLGHIQRVKEYKLTIELVKDNTSPTFWLSSGSSSEDSSIQLVVNGPLRRWKQKLLIRDQIPGWVGYLIAESSLSCWLCSYMPCMQVTQSKVYNFQ